MSRNSPESECDVEEDQELSDDDEDEEFTDDDDLVEQEGEDDDMDDLPIFGVPYEPSALVASLARFIAREYAASRRFGISIDEIVNKVNWTHKKEVSEEHIKEAISIAVDKHKLFFSNTYQDSPDKSVSAFRGIVRNKPKTFKPTSSETFSVMLLSDVDYLTISDWLGLFIEQDEGDTEKLEAYRHKNAHLYVVVGYPKIHVETYDNTMYPLPDQTNRIVKMFDSN
jgi:hypothetical protein